MSAELVPARAATSATRVSQMPRSPITAAAATDAPWPDAPQFKVTKLSYVMSLMPASIVRDLGMERLGYRIFPLGPYYQAWPDGRSVSLWQDDARRNHEQIAKFSTKDADAM